MTDVRQALIELGQQLSAEDGAAQDLWSWLPPHKAAIAGHGDYASEHRPSNRDIMVEAALFISHRLNPTPEQIEGAGDYYRCSCGEEHAAGMKGDSNAP